MCRSEGGKEWRRGPGSVFYVEASNDSRYITVLRLWIVWEWWKWRQSKYILFTLKSILKCFVSIKIKNGLKMFNTPRANMGGGGIWAKLVKSQLLYIYIIYKCGRSPTLNTHAWEHHHLTVRTIMHGVILKEHHYWGAWRALQALCRS